MTNLKKLRKKKGITQHQLALSVGVKKNTIALYEQGRRNINKASAEIVYQLSLALSCRMEELLEVQNNTISEDN